MSQFSRGDDVVVEFGGLGHQGEVISQSAGYVTPRMTAWLFRQLNLWPTR